MAQQPNRSGEVQSILPATMGGKRRQVAALQMISRYRYGLTFWSAATCRRFVLLLPPTSRARRSLAMRSTTDYKRRSLPGSIFSQLLRDQKAAALGLM